MRRVALALQIVLATVLVVLWLRWNPLSRRDCRGADCERQTPSIYVDPVEERTSGCWKTLVGRSGVTIVLGYTRMDCTFR